MDGTKFPAVNTVAPIEMSKKIVGVIEILRDITNEKSWQKLRTNLYLWRRIS
jgi:hypothetical protein